MQLKTIITEKAEIMINSFVLKDEFEAICSNLATKDDLRVVRDEVKAEVKAVRDEAKEDNNKLHIEIVKLEAKVNSVDTNVKWIIAILMLVLGISAKNLFV